MAEKLSLLYSYFIEVQWLLLIQLCQSDAIAPDHDKKEQKRIRQNYTKE